MPGYGLVAAREVSSDASQFGRADLGGSHIACLLRDQRQLDTRKNLPLAVAVSVMCGRPVGKGFLSRALIGCFHVSGLFVRDCWPAGPDGNPPARSLITVSRLKGALNQTGSSRRRLDRHASSTAFAISCARPRPLRRAKPPGGRSLLLSAPPMRSARACWRARPRRA
jgi:hypothetical protein